MKAADTRSAHLIRIAQEDGATLADVPDGLLVGMARYSVTQKRAADEYVTEMNRRLKDAVESMTAELVIFRESAEAAATRQEAAADRAEASATRLEGGTRVLVWFTAALVALTVAVLALTAVVAATG